jgi:hypothetical protein
MGSTYVYYHNLCWVASIEEVHDLDEEAFSSLAHLEHVLHHFPTCAA